MAGKINSGDLCTIEPIDASEVRIGDVVLCRVKGAEYLHLVKAVGPAGQVLIGNNRGKTNGWTRAIYGRLVSVEP